jgi:hypothetical protein
LFAERSAGLFSLVPDRRGGLGVVRDDVTVKAGLNEAQRVQNPIGDRRKFGGGWAKSVFADEPLQMKEHPKIWFRILSDCDLDLPCGDAEGLRSYLHSFSDWGPSVRM